MRHPCLAFMWRGHGGNIRESYTAGGGFKKEKGERERERERAFHRFNSSDSPSCGRALWRILHVQRYLSTYVPIEIDHRRAPGKRFIIPPLDNTRVLAFLFPLAANIPSHVASRG
jgi:hypothetical protein